MARLGAGDAAAAALDLRAACAARPKDARAREHLGRALLALDRRDEARAALVEAAALDPARPHAHRLVAELDLRGRPAAEAAPRAERAAELASTTSSAGPPRAAWPWRPGTPPARRRTWRSPAPGRPAAPT
ncbi:MAG: tetratricopeptide repeat protein [Planctomycetes bacterium]|nr:tetratricopeptide repeat protein [Planctomycetota bacterium]